MFWPDKNLDWYLKSAITHCIFLQSEGFLYKIVHLHWLPVNTSTDYVSVKTIQEFEENWLVRILVVGISLDLVSACQVCCNAVNNILGSVDNPQNSTQAASTVWCVAASPLATQVLLAQLDFTDFIKQPTIVHETRTVDLQ